jgi:hypothetical protein
MLESVRSMAPEGRQAEIDLAEIKALLTYDSIGWELGRAEVQANTPVERPPAIKALERLLESLDAQPAADSTVKSDILMTIANTQLEYAQRYVLLASKFAENAPAYGAGAWAQLSAAAGHLNAAAKLPRTAATPAEFLPNCYIELLKSTLMRARLATIHEPALRNAQALFDNCAAYGAKAAEALKWNYPRLPSSKTGMTPLFSDSLSVPSPAGWDMEMLARDLALNLLRVCFFAKTETILTETGTAAMYEMAAKSLVDSLKSIREDPRRLGPRDIRRFVGDIEDSEGALSPEEVAWWKEVEEGLHVVEDTSAAAQQVNAMFG